MTGKGRPPTGQRVDVRIPDELVARIDAEAKSYGITRAAQIRHIITIYYEKESQP